MVAKVPDILIDFLDLLFVTETSVNSEAAKLMKPSFGKISKTRLTHHCVYPCITEGVIFDVPKNVHH